jgi:FKBP-type peptidyl-prolyl cis-trans isomerase SlyD
MIIQKHAVVSVNYTLSSRKSADEQESIIEKTNPEDPFVFLFGAGGLIEGFEKNMAGKKSGESFDFYLKPGEAYGEYNKEHVIPIPIEAFKNKQGEIDRSMLVEGEVIPMVDDRGNQIQGTIQKVTLDQVVMDFNHPMAGHELHFMGEILSVREATQEEIDHGHVHGPGGHHH